MNSKSVFKISTLTLFLLASISQAQNVGQTFYDTVNPNHGFVEICKTNADGTLIIATHCGRFAQIEKRFRTELVEVFDEYQGFKKYDEVSVYLSRRGEAQVVPMTVSYLFETGHANVYEFYTAGRGPNSGSIHHILPINKLYRETTEVRGIKKGDQVCVKQGFKMKYGFSHEHEFEFKKDEKYRVVKVFANGYANLKMENNPLLDMWNYGSGNKLHVYFQGPHFMPCK